MNSALAPRRVRSQAASLACLPLVLALALRLASAPTADLSYLAIAAYALMGRRQAIVAIAACWLFSMLNPGIAPPAGAATVGRYAVLLAAAVSVAGRSAILSPAFRVRRFTLATILLGLLVVTHSLLVSAMPDVSVLKALSWTVATATLVAAWAGLPSDERDDLARHLHGGLVLVLVAGLPLSATPLGYLVNGSGFQGLLNHPQAFGSMAALLGAWTVARMIGQPRPPFRLVAIAAACCAGVVMSEARTAGLAMTVGVALGVVLVSWFSGRSLRHAAPGLRSARIWWLTASVLVGAVAMAPQIGNGIDHYVTKSGRSDVRGLLEAYERSRGWLIDAMLENVQERPLSGIGFGIASQPSMMVVERDPLLGLPVGAAVEKGVAPLAVLEELGAFLAALVTFWVWRLVRRCARNGLAPFTVCLTALLLNLGEATLFSPGGMGLVVLVLLGWGQAGSGRPSPSRPIESRRADNLAAERTSGAVA